MALKEILAKFGFEIDDKPLKKADKEVDSFAKKVVSAFAAAEIVGGIKSWVTGLMDLEGQITDTSEALGVSRTSLQEWSYVASRGGASTEDVATAFKILQKNAVDGGKAFSDLGVKVKDASGEVRPVEDLMNDVANGLANVQNPAERTKLALELLGKGGTKLLPILSKGGEELDSLRARFKELGGGLSEDALDGIGAAADALDDVELASKSLKGNLFLVLAPALKWVTNVFANVVAHFNKGSEATSRLHTALGILGAAGAAAGYTMLKPYIPFLLTIGGIYLLVQDFYTFLQGGDSATGRLLEWLFGEGAADEIRDDIKGLSDDVKKFKKELDQKPGGGNILDWVEEGFSRAGFELVKFFADDIPEAVSLATDGRIENIWKQIGSDSVFGFIDALLGGLPTAIKLFVENMRQMVTGAKSAFDGFVDFGSQLIDDFIAGVVKGFNTGVDKVKKAAVDLVTGGIKEPMRVALDSHSPSKEAERIFATVPQGGIKALRDWLPDVSAVSERLATASMSPIVAGATYANRNISAPISNQNSIVIHGAANPQATGSAVAGSLARWGFDDRNRLMAVLDTQ